MQASKLVVAGAIVLVAGVALGGANHARAVAVRAAATPASASLNEVSVAPGTRDAWAVGGAGSSVLGGSWVLRLHGGKWQVVTAAKAATSRFDDVAAASDKEIWIAGFVQSTPPVTTPLLERSAGGSFRAVNLPTHVDGALVSVSASSTKNAWAVGYLGQAEAASPKLSALALRWNGRAWKKVPVLTGRRGFQLTAVSSSSPDNAWAIAANNTTGSTLLLRWTGTRWATSPYTAPTGAVLNGIATSSGSDTWVVGYTSTTKGVDTYAARWNGSRWTTVPTPQSHAFSMLLGVSAIGKNAWAVGEELVKASTGRMDPLIIRFTAGAWQRQKTPNPAGQPADGQSALTGVSAVAPSFGVAVGYYFLDGGSCGPVGPEAASYQGRSWKASSLPKPPGTSAMFAPDCGG